MIYSTDCYGLDLGSEGSLTLVEGLDEEVALTEEDAKSIGAIAVIADRILASMYTPTKNKALTKRIKWRGFVTNLAMPHWRPVISAAHLHPNLDYN